MNGTIFNIQRFSIDDGPGIRTVVFLKGCTLRCAWCHNPEGLQQTPEIMFFPQKCIGCGQCFEVCLNNGHVIIDGERLFVREACERCGKCAAVCYAEALETTGRSISSGEAVDEIKKDDLFYKNSGGGVTFSGGEPLLQVDFIKEVFIACKALGYHCAVETAGHVPWGAFEKILPYTDLFLYDIKIMDEVLHKQCTGSGNKRIIGNLKKLVNAGAEVIVRTPEIPGINDTPEEKQKLAALLAELGGLNHEVLPYHRLGENKYESLGLAKPQDFTRDILQ